MAKCEQRERLLEAYKRATEIYAKTVGQLHGDIRQIAHEDYAPMARAISHIRDETIAAREELKQHTAQHRCLGMLHDDY